MKRFLKHILVACVLFAAVPVLAVEDVVVMGLFGEKAVLTIDGKRRSLSVGERSPEGVVLVAVDAERNEATLEIDGKRDVYGLGMHISGGYTTPAATEISLWADSMGMFNVAGSINGLSVDFLVDTGATTIAMNSQQAKRLGIDYLYKGQQINVSTASGNEIGYLIKLKTVKVRELELREVEAIVMDGEHPEQALLGMSFLGKLEMNRSGNHMVLRKKN